MSANHQNCAVRFIAATLAKNNLFSQFFFATQMHSIPSTFTLDSQGVEFNNQITEFFVLRGNWNMKIG